MVTRILAARRDNPEALGFLATLVFACLASVRDVYLGGLFQRLHPLDFTLVAFALCTLLFFPAAVARTPESLRVLARHPGLVAWVNATSALAWIAFFYALRAIEPSIVQLLFSGVGPLSVLWIERFLPGAPSSGALARGERMVLFGLFGAVVLAAAVVLAGRSAMGPQPLAIAALGVGLAVVSGVSISVSTMVCRQLNDRGVTPTALVGVRFLGAMAAAAVLRGGADAPGLDGATWSAAGLGGIAAAALLLIVLPIFVNQIGIALASPLTVRVVVAVGPVLILGLQVIEGRLSASAYSLAAALIYAVFAVAATLVRRRAVMAVSGG
jgi:drug/metabolite transporter (DMT)-like permease